MNISKIAVLALSLSMLISTVFVSNDAYAGLILNGPTVGGLPVPINEFELFGALAQQYSLWLIPAISAIGIGAFLFKRKF